MLYALNRRGADYTSLSHTIPAEKHGNNYGNDNMCLSINGHVRIYLSAMASVFGTCPVCMDDYDLDTGVPKSLDCRHSVCNVCLQSGADSMNTCPICRHPIRDHQNIPNDLTMIDYLERNKGETVVILKSKLQEMRDNVKKELQETVNILRQAIETDQLFASNAKHIFYRCVEKYQHITPVSSYDRDDVESKLERLQRSLADCERLLEKAYIRKDDMGSCEIEVKEAVKELQCRERPETAETVLWIKYKQELINAFTEMSHDTPSSLPYVSTGKL